MRLGRRNIVATSLAGCFLAVAAVGVALRPGGVPVRTAVDALGAIETGVARALLWEPADPHATPGVGMFLVHPEDPGVSTPVERVERTPPALVVLVHGLDEPGSIWDTLTPALLERGHAVAQFWYPNDGPIARSAEALAERLRDLRARGTRRVDVVAHSMGGLVVRDALTREGMYGGEAGGHADLPDVGRVILVGTPNHGSPWARLRAIAEVREQVLRLAKADRIDRAALTRFLRDGTGEAGRDLLPGSAFLNDLNGRPLPSGCRITVIAGRLAGEGRLDPGNWEIAPVIRDLFGSEGAALLGALEQVSGALGDGVVPVSSALLEGVGDVVVVEGSHRGMLDAVALEAWVRSWVDGNQRPAVPPAIPIILDRLSGGSP